MNELSFNKKLLVVSIFAIAMGFLEAIVVVYVRELYYPEGFEFPLILLPEKIFLIELVRELTTLIMLAAIGILAGRTRVEKFAWFLISFGIWDIFYYAGLKIFLGWPESLLTWDILFLIPITWLGPVLAPVIAACTMILLGWVIIKTPVGRLKSLFLSWTLIYSGAVIIFISFIYNYAVLLAEQNVFKRSGPGLSDPEVIEIISSYIPDHFLWWLFLLGELIILAGIALRIYHQKRIS